VFALEVEYLLGRVFAGDFRDRSEPEWPPHPARLFSALAAAHFENGKSPRERAALQWLERQAPPFIRAGQPGHPVMTQAFVPTNYPNDNLPVTRNKQPRYFPAQAPSETSVYFIWPNADPDPATIAALDRLAARTGYLGKACSLVRMRVTPEAPEPNFSPDEAGDRVLRVPSQGRLDELEWLFTSDRRPSPGRQQRYTRLDTEPAAQEPIATEFHHIAVFRKTAGPGLPIEATLTLTEAVRTALLAVAGDAGPIDPLLHGHNQDTHCAVIGLPFVGRQHADGHLMGFAVILPARTEVVQRRSVFATCATLAARGLHIPGIGDWSLEAVDATPLNHNLRPATWTRPSRHWTSITPILLDRFPKKNGPAVEDILAAACRRIGLPSPLSIEHSPYSAVPGVPPVPAFRLRRKGEQRSRWGVHSTLDFPFPVRGPVLLGAGRYFGLGLMRPQTESNLQAEAGNDQR
jgi:CRISPR-associated protein Csb2